MKVSVIVPTLNEEQFIEKCLKSVNEQNFPREQFELIVVDSSSTDKTVEIAKKLSDKTIICERKGAAFGRNVGAKQAKGDYFLFLDGDSVACKDWIKNGVDSLQHTVCCSGPALPLEENTGFHTKIAFFLWNSLAFLCSKLNRPIFIGANLGIRKQVFEEVGGFLDTGKTGEDFELSLKVSRTGKIDFNKGMLVYTSIRRLKEHGLIGYGLHGVAYLIFRKGIDWQQYRKDFKD